MPAKSKLATGQPNSRVNRNKSGGRSGRRRSSRRGYTLIEILIGATITLVLLGIMIRAFVYAGNEISKGRAVIELVGELRDASETLRVDLRYATCRSLPWTAVGASEGYIEYTEGVETNLHDFGTALSDIDDVLMLTARNLENHYQGLYNNTVIESKVAEIAWWVSFADQDGDGHLDPDLNETAVVYRRVLLVAPQLNDDITGHLLTAVPESDYLDFLQANDISVRFEDPDGDLTGNVIANSLADLTRRENRFAHNRAFPGNLTAANLSSAILTGVRQGEDVVLSQAHAFDIQIFDPFASIHSATLPDGEIVVLSPSDPGYAANTTSMGTGTYVDLNYAADVTVSSFSGASHAKSQLSTNTYCTWSSSYERDGIDQDDGGGTIDEGTDGIDDDGTFGIDDEAERETAPPYLHPLRGLKVTFRVRDPSSQQVRQTSIESSFVPE